MPEVYYYWYFDEDKNIIKLNHCITNIRRTSDSLIKEDTKTYTSIADAMKSAPKFAEIVNV